MSDLNIQESRKRPRFDDDEMGIFVMVLGFIMVVVGAWYGKKYRLKEITWNESERARTRATWMNTLRNDRICREQLRLDIRRFEKLCHMLQTKGGLKTTRNVTIKEIVALFLHTLAHDLKNRTMQALFARSGETISRQFHVVLAFMLKLGKYYIKQAGHTTSYVDDNKWRFEGVIGALNGTHIDMTVPIEDRPRYRDRKGNLSTNVIATCDPNLRFTSVVPGWEGSTSDPRVLRDALRRPNGLKVPTNKYLLVDLGYSNAEGFLAPYKVKHSLNSECSELETPTASAYQNKCIENWDDICTLFAPNRAIGYDVVSSFDESFKEYVSKSTKPTSQEIYKEVSSVLGISRHQALRAVKRFLNGTLEEFDMLKNLPDDQN
uniref:DDE Tnp4 domain-containing protein n=1 Tax=Chenopodium quinoa TaxID=63459 RepID=A0A803MYQ5_CHEQI